MKITDISIQAKNKDRVNVSVDGSYRFSLDISQVGELGVKIGKEYSQSELESLETESQFGKLYGRALEYCLMRPHSAKEVHNYLYRKTQATLQLSKKTGQLYKKPGIPKDVAERVYRRLRERGHIDDEKFTRYWVENRNVAKGMSQRKLTAELRAKGVDQSIIGRALGDSTRTDTGELRKVIAKKARRYDDRQKLINYLARQGFRYDDIVSELENTD